MPTSTTHFILPVPSQPRFHKRIAGFKAAGVRVKVYAFERDYFQGQASSLAYTRLGRLQHGSYARRLPILLTALPVIWRNIQNGDIIYCFGLDTALLGTIIKKIRGRAVRLVYECGDITPLMIGTGRTSSLMRRAERGVLGAADRVVITAPAFADQYFIARQGVAPDKLFVIENKLDVRLPQPVPTAIWDGVQPLRLGYFGLLRDPKAWRIMLAWAQKTPDRFRLDVRGYPFGIAGIEQDIAAHSNISFGGEYVYPDDLPELYGDVDLVWVTYPKLGEIDDLRWQWPRTNRFYEACYFGKPMIGQTDSADGDLIERYDIGLTIDTDELETALARLLAIQPADLMRWTNNLRALPSETFLYTDEHKRLLAALT